MEALEGAGLLSAQLVVVGGLLNSGHASVTGIVVNPGLSPSSGGIVNAMTVQCGVDTDQSVAASTGLHAMGGTRIGTGMVGQTYGARITKSILGTENYGVAIEACSTATLWVSHLTDEITADGGITFGLSKDTNLYRSGANSLRTDDSLVVGGSIATGTTNLGNVGLNIGGTISGASHVFGVYMGTQTLGPGNGANAYFVYGGGGTVDTGSGNTIGMSTAVYAAPITKSGTGTLTNTYGMWVDPSTAGTNNIGIQIAGAPSVGLALPPATIRSLWVNNITDSTGPLSGIGFGVSLDTAIHRSAVGTLKVVGAGGIVADKFTPATVSTGWAATAGFTPLKTFNPTSVTAAELARVVGTIVDTLKAYGMFGA
jgi:hypothetical protein